MKPLIISVKTAAGERAQEFIDSQKFTADANLSSVDKPPRVILDLKNEALKNKRIADWKLAQALKIEQSILQKKQDAYDKAGLRWWTGRILSIGVYDPMWTHTQPKVYMGQDEADTIKRFFDYLGNFRLKDNYLVGKSKDFDLPFLIGRCIALDIGIPDKLFSRYQLGDVSEIFGKTASSTQKGKLSDYAFGVGMAAMESFDSPTFLLERSQLGDDTAWKEIERQTSYEVKVLGEIMRRYHKVYKVTSMETAEVEQEAKEDFEIPFGGNTQ